MSDAYMRMSRLYAPTLKEDPAEAELASHKLLLRAGFIRRTAAGLYSYLPLAWRSLRKIETIVREEEDVIGAQEILVPMVVPGELWHDSGRWEAYGPELLRMKDRHDRDFVMGPTHEETFTDLVKNELKSYKQLPVTLYQIQDKFRDELRPRFGLMRGREFIMKDAYSFDATVEGMQRSYEDQKAAYARMCERCGLKALPVAADSGQIGGDTSVEFMALAEAGEAALVWCDCGYAADVEAATAGISWVEGPGSGELEKIETPCEGTIAALAEFMGIPETATRKSFAIIAEDGTPVLCLLPGDHELCDVKAEHAFGHYDAMDEEQMAAYGLVKGYMGPVGADERVRVVADVSLRESESWLIGANEAGYHYQGAKPGRDFECEWLDLAEAKAGDACPVCGQPLKEARGIEVSQVFQLGTKYSEAMGALFMDEDGQEKPFQMGCYGVGVSRTLQAVVEQSHDDAGIIWPVSVAPYEVEVVSLDVKGEVFEAAEALASAMTEAGLEVLLDDRKERPGVKFAEADLMGFPWQVVVGRRGVKEGTVELKCRATGERRDVAISEVVDELVPLIVPARAGLVGE